MIGNMVYVSGALLLNHLEETYGIFTDCFYYLRGVVFNISFTDEETRT